MLEEAGEGEVDLRVQNCGLIAETLGRDLVSAGRDVPDGVLAIRLRQYSEIQRADEHLNRRESLAGLRLVTVPLGVPCAAAEPVATNRPATAS